MVDTYEEGINRRLPWGLWTDIKRFWSPKRLARARHQPRFLSWLLVNPHNSRGARCCARSSEKAVDLPEGVWANVSKFMLAKEWAEACKTCPASYRARRRLVVAEVRDELSKDEQVLMRQLQLERWPESHSLCLNLWQLHKTAKLTPEQSEVIGNAAKTLRFLHCLHIIGRHEVPLMDDCLEGVLMSSLAQHVSVLTLHVDTVIMPLDLPLLQHLVLELGTIPCALDRSEGEVGHETLFPALSDLKGLKTLCLKADNATILDLDVDLTGCVHLQHVAVQGLRFQSLSQGNSLALPAKCRLHIISEAFRYMWSQHGVASQVTELTLCCLSHKTWYGLTNYEWLLKYSNAMGNLKQLRLTLNKVDIQKSYRVKGDSKFCFDIPPGVTPSLEVLELYLHCSLAVTIPSEVKLKSLVIIAAGTLHLHELELGKPPISTLKRLYLQSGAPFSLSNIAILHDCHAENVRVLEGIMEKRCCYIAQMPDGFRPPNLEECFCNACPECLARNGVPILCDRIWSSEGFDKHLRANCSGELAIINPQSVANE